MSDTLREFLIGFGFDFDTDSVREVNSSLDNVTSKALQLGAVVAGVFGFKNLTSDFAATTDMLGKFASVLDTDASRVAAFGRALEHEGGTFESFLSQLENLQRMRSGVMVGDTGFIGAAGAAGVDTSGFISALDPLEAYLELAEQFQDLSSKQRLNAAEVFGLDPASIRLLSYGRDAIEDLVGREEAMRPITPEMTAEAARFNDEMQDLQTNIGGLADIVSMELLPPINDLIGGMNEFIRENRQNFEQNVTVSANVLKWNPETMVGIMQDIGIPGMAPPASDQGSTKAPVASTPLNQPVIYTGTVQRLNAPTPAAVPPTPIQSQQSSTKIRVEVPLMLDGRVIERVVRDVDARANQDALNALTTGVGG